MKSNSIPVAIVVLAGFFNTDVSAQPIATPAPATTPPISAGLLNDYLRNLTPALTNWDFGGQVRARFESKSGFAVPGAGANAVDFSLLTPDNNYWLLREKLHLGWKPTSWLVLFAEGRNSASYNDKRTPEPEEDSTDLNQAYLVVGNAKEFPITAKVGRQELIYGDERLVGASDWNNLGRVFDAAKLRYENDAFWVDAFASRVVLANDGVFNVDNDYDWFSGLYASTRTIIPKQETQLYFLARNTGAQSPTATTGSPQAGGPTARDIYTAGFRIKSLPGQFGGWDYDAECAGQFGDFYDATLTNDLNHLAFAAHAGGGYTWTEAMGTPRLGLEYNFASGDSNPTDGKHGTFENLFPTNHKFYGYMDFFSWQNLHNVRFTSALKPVKGLTVTLDYHLFWLANTEDFFYTVNGAARRTGGYGINANNGNFAGSEVDLVATYTVKNWANVQAGYGHFFRGDYVKESLVASGSQDANWFYAQVALNF
ncbi:MAG: alginate export family protein [Verrucomicrobiota bacterium]